MTKIRKQMIPDPPEGGSGGEEGEGAEPVVDVNLLKSPQGSTEPPVPPAEGNKPPPTPPAAGGNEPPKSPADYTPSPIWDSIKSEEGDDFKLPEGLTSENEVEKINEYYKNKYVTTNTGNVDITILPPYVQELIVESQKEDFDVNNYYSKKAEFSGIVKGTDDQVIAQALILEHGAYDAESNPDGFTQEDIDDYISGLNKVQKKKEATSYRKQLEENQTKVSQEQIDKMNQQRATRIQELNDLQATQRKELFVKTRQIPDIYGIKVSQTDHEAFEKLFEKITTVDKNGQVPLINDIVNLSNEELYKLAYIRYNLSPDKFQEYITDLKEETKNNLISKTQLRFSSEGGGSPQNNAEVDINKLKSPEIRK